MKIKNIKSWKEDLKLARPYTIAFKTIDEVENCFVSIELENGIVGLGAANPSKPVVGESITDTVNALQYENINWLEGEDILSINKLCQQLLEQYKPFPAARAALDIALHDAFCQHLEVPLVRFLGQFHFSLPTSITIGIKSLDDSLSEAREYIERGFKFLKVKLGKSVEQDIALIIKLRENYKHLNIRVDINQGYRLDELKIFYNSIKLLNIELIEQPLPVKDFETIKELPDDIKNIIAADESLISVQDAFHLNQNIKTCGIYNIKLMKCGGVSQAMKIGEIANLTKTSLMWGCNDESAISISAALHAAFANKNTKFIDLDGSLDLEKDIVTGGFALKGGMMSILDKPGLGVKMLQ